MRLFLVLYLVSNVSFAARNFWNREINPVTSRGYNSADEWQAHTDEWKKI